MRYFLILLLWLPTQGLAQSEVLPCSEDSVLHLIDFWLGEWEVYDQEDNKVGDNKIEKILNGCAIRESWASVRGGRGMSIFYKNQTRNSLKQVWVTGNANRTGGTKEKDLLHAVPGEMALFQGTYRTPTGQLVLDRTLLFELEQGAVKQEIQYSVDGGQNWTTSFIGVYKKK